MQKNNSDSSSTATSRILIADDNEPNRELLEVYLADVDCEIATAIDGSDTLEKENVYVATDDERIGDVVEEHGYNVIYTSEECLTGTDRVAEASLKIDADVIVNVQGDEALLDPNDIIKAVSCKIDNEEWYSLTDDSVRDLVFFSESLSQILPLLSLRLIILTTAENLP